VTTRSDHAPALRHTVIGSPIGPHPVNQLPEDP